MDSHRTHSIPRYLTTAAGNALLCSVLFALALAGPARSAFAQEPGAQGPDFLAPARTSADDPIPVARPTNPCGGTGQVGRGVALQTSIGGRLLALTAADAASFSSGFQWNVLVGYKFCRILVGLSLDLSVDSPAGTSAVTTSFLLAPEIQIAMVRSADHRAELVGTIGVGLGTIGGNGHVAAKLGPGVRYWLHPHIAINTLVGLNGDLVLLGKNQAALVSLFGTIGVLGAF